ncbi:hypothetical protein BGZ61DRAFT_535878 [Ilyonectria robusta]|uniref:uncharacterized protein n=1 Tax=Ilyonectria robusta TaxID=1079257 RepID=UPI001E8CC96D|nr:uncharacterized protein BGZ61DRAFT_535878 [Ilyonectria robusta]KAH8679491.1 hypothetical protein BGZ61DRAFT_535878 [Ilyonectria robusta]
MQTLPSFTFLALGLSLLARYVAAQTTIGDREKDLASSQFIGYYIAPDSIQKMTASTSWITSGTFAGDCNSDFDSCVVATEFSNDTIYFGDGSSTSCGTFSCVSMTIFQTSPDGLPSATNIKCRQGWRAYTVYRELETRKLTVASLETSSTFAESTSNERGIAEATSSETTSATSTGATASAEPTSEPKKSKSKAWIAGAVVGSIAGLAVISGAGWFYMRSQNRAKSDPIASTLQPRTKEEPRVEMPGH